MEIPTLILDTSAAMALFLQEEEGCQIEETLKELIASNSQIIVTSLFWYEVGNTLVSALNRKRITIEELRGIEIDLAELALRLQLPLESFDKRILAALSH